MASIDKRPNGTWRARYREHPGGPQRARHFDRKVDAERFLTNVQSRLLDGSYVDPSAGQQGLREYAARTGLRQGECFGLSVDRVDFLRRTIRVDRQLVLAGKGQPEFGPPKTDASVRTVPLPGSSAPPSLPTSTDTQRPGTA